MFKLFDDYCLIVDLPHWVRSIRRSSIDSVYVHRMGGFFADVSANGQSFSFSIESIDEGLRLLAWHLGRPIPPPEILAIEDPVAYEEATKAWVKTSCEKTPEP